MYQLHCGLMEDKTEFLILGLVEQIYHFEDVVPAASQIRDAVVVVQQVRGNC